MASRTSQRVRGAVLVAAVTAVSALAAGCSSSGDTPESKPSPSPATPARITLAVYGPEPVLAAYREIARDFDVSDPDAVVTVKTYRDHQAAMAALGAAQAAGTPPDVFLMDHDDLRGLADAKAIRRVDDLLGERRVDFGDGYGRTGLEAFSANSALQCMPADVSPLVVFYNPTLVDLPTVAEPGRNEVNQQDGWSMDEFATAARQPARPGVRGLYVAPSIEQVAPFVWSGGGEVVDDTDEPTSLQLSDGSSTTALEQLLELVRDPTVTPSQEGAQRLSALDRFKAGRLAIMLGHRDLVPELRAQPDLFFDVMPMPRLSSRATTAQFQGLCLSSGTGQTDAAADLLTYLVSDDSARRLAATGYTMPTNLGVLNSGTFLQGDQQPLHAQVFVRGVRDARPLPDAPAWPEVETQLDAALSDLFYQPVIDPLADRLAAIDAASMPVFDPKLQPTESPSPTPSGTPSESPSESASP